MRFFSLFILVVIAASCSPQKRLSRLIRKHPELVRDSIRVDSFHIARLVHDTTLQFTDCDSNTTDTFYITTPRFNQVIIRKGKTLKSNTDVHDTTLKVIERTKLVPYESKKRCFTNYFHLFIAFFFGVGLSAILFRITGGKR